MVWGDASLRSLIWQPILLGMALMVILTGLGFWFGTGVLLAILHGLGWGHLAPGSVLAGLGVSALLIWFAGPLFITLTSLISGFYWDRLSRLVEWKATGECPSDTLLPSETVGDLAFRLPYAALTVILVIVSSVLQVPWVGYLFLGIMGLYDYTASAFHRRHIAFLKQVPRAWGQKGSLGFVLSTALFSAIPILNVLMLPSFVAGGTLMMLDKWNSPQTRSSPVAKEQ